MYVCTYACVYVCVVCVQAASQQVTCEDILILDTKANVLTVQQINDLNTTDFDNCAETLGTATGWSLEQKAALIGKAKQAS